MAVWLDIIGSFLLGTLLLLNVMRMNADVSEKVNLQTLTYATQENAATIAEIMEDDLRKVGLGVGGTAIILADSTQLRFLADLDLDGVVDTLYYYVGSPAEASGTPNPKDRFLYRAVSGQALQRVGTGVTRFTLSYFDADGDSLGLPVMLGDIRQIRVTYVVESDISQDTTYARAFMEFRLFPKNLDL